MSTYVVGYRPADETWDKHLAVWEACDAAGVDIPQETLDFFDDESPLDKPGMEVSIKNACKEYQNEYQQGYEVDITKLPKDVKILRFVNSW